MLQSPPVLSRCLLLHYPISISGYGLEFEVSDKSLPLTTSSHQGFGSSIAQRSDYRELRDRSCISVVKIESFKL